LNPAKEILEFAEGEPIEAVVFGDDGDYLFIVSNSLECGKLYTWEEVEGMLNHEYDCDFGEHTLPPMNIWTKSFLIYTSEYDGSNLIQWMYRNPTAYTPSF